MSYQYKRADGADFFVPGVGASFNGVLTTDEKIENVDYLVPVEPEQPTPPVQSVATAQPGAVIGVAPQATQTPLNTEAK